jgi:hypothetical protein
VRSDSQPRDSSASPLSTTHCALAQSMKMHLVLYLCRDFSKPLVTITDEKSAVVSKAPLSHAGPCIPSGSYFPVSHANASSPCLPQPRHYSRGPDICSKPWTLAPSPHQKSNVGADRNCKGGLCQLPPDVLRQGCFRSLDPKPWTLNPEP